MKKPRVLDEPRTSYRIGDKDGAFPVYSGEGARLYPGRWNRQGDGVIYTCEHLSTAMLEKLAYLGELPSGQDYITITIPAGTSYEVLSVAKVPKWDRPNHRVSQKFGRAWFKAQRSAILIVPSVLVRTERNIIINPLHPDAAKITHGLEEPIWWDPRFFG